jgi:hypothetical protein
LGWAAAFFRLKEENRHSLELEIDLVSIHARHNSMAIKRFRCTYLTLMKILQHKFILNVHH